MSLTESENEGIYIARYHNLETLIFSSLEHRRRRFAATAIYSPRRVQYLNVSTANTREHTTQPKSPKIVTPHIHPPRWPTTAQCSGSERKSMSSYLSNLLTTTSSKYTTLRRTLLSDESDGLTEDDTHLCRVLRAHYTEKARPFPPWLPPDPNAPAPVAIHPVYSQNSVGAGYGGLGAQAGGARGGLSSLWDKPADGGGPGQAAQSLRSGRGAPPQVQAGRPQPRPDPYSRGSSSMEQQPVEARPLPSQRAGSYQVANTGPAFGRVVDSVTGSAGAGGGGTAQERLKARLWGAARAASPSGSLDSRSSGREAGGGSQGGQRPNPYANASFGSAGGGQPPPASYGNGGASRAGGDRPFVAATSPWASSEAEFSGGGYGGGGGGGGGGARSQQPVGRTGLPSGPGQRTGLPSGPRSMR